MIKWSKKLGFEFLITSRKFGNLLICKIMNIKNPRNFSRHITMGDLLHRQQNTVV